MAGQSCQGLIDSMTGADRRYRQRIIGAVVLVLLAVTFLPMLFDRTEPSREVRVEVPPRPWMPQMRPLGEPEVPVPQAQAPDVTAETAVADEHLDGDGLPINWAVMVARVALPDEAMSLRAELAGQGLDSYVRREPDWYAVYIGPFLDLEKAEEHLDRFARDGEHDPRLVRYQPQPIGG